MLVANDSTPNYLYINKGDGTFEDESYASGFALNEDGREMASMGIAVGDYQNNGLVDLCQHDFLRRLQGALSQRRRRELHRRQLSSSASRRSPSPFSAGATAFIDYDNDGWKDLFMVNGHVYPQVDKHDWGTTFAERPLLFHNLQGQEVRARAAGERHRAWPMSSPGAARPSAICSTTARSMWSSIRSTARRCCCAT